MTLHKSFKNLTLTRFIEEIELKRCTWIVKRLSGNDTGVSGHQAGPYLPRIFFERTIPEICTTDVYNPKAYIEECYFPALDESIKRLRAVYYNNKYFPEKKNKKKYDEFRITCWGGSSSPMLDKENTGSICLLAVFKDEGKLYSVAWIASSLKEEEIIENWLGSEVEPGRFKLSNNLICETELKIEIPKDWFNSFPTGKEIFSFVITQIPGNTWKREIDYLLLKRRELEFNVFREIEAANTLPIIANGFTSVEDFLKCAHTVSNRRKSRTGTSLELNLEAIFNSEKILFETQVITENKKKPDFLFPSGKAYHDCHFPEKMLRMMAAKTCCKDRWRQILNEADRISPKHLFTLQQGVSSNQLKEMFDHNVKLVVPKPHIKSFPKDERSKLITLEQFVHQLKEQQTNTLNLY